MSTNDVDKYTQRSSQGMHLQGKEHVLPCHPPAQLVIGRWIVHSLSYEDRFHFSLPYGPDFSGRFFDTSPSNVFLEEATGYSVTLPESAVVSLNVNIFIFLALKKPQFYSE